jgi:membrane-bound lytic murein transglycosylase D
LPPIANHPYFQQVRLSRDVDVALAARLADLRIEDFKALNPSAQRPVIIASGTPYILLPWDNALVFQRNFDAYSKGQYASWTAWAVPTTLSVSDAAKRVGMSENDLRNINNIPPRMLIKAGSTLLISRSAKMENDVASDVADNAQISLAPEIVTRRTSVKARSGETVASIAKRYGLSSLNVAEWNRTSVTSSFKLGQEVVLFLPIKSTAKQRNTSNGKGVAKPLNRKATVQPKKR